MKDKSIREKIRDYKKEMDETNLTPEYRETLFECDLEIENWERAREEFELKYREDKGPYYYEYINSDEE